MRLSFWKSTTFHKHLVYYYPSFGNIAIYAQTGKIIELVETVDDKIVFLD